MNQVSKDPAFFSSIYYLKYFSKWGIWNCMAYIINPLFFRNVEKIRTRYYSWLRLQPSSGSKHYWQFRFTYRLNIATNIELKRIILPGIFIHFYEYILEDNGFSLDILGNRLWSNVPWSVNFNSNLMLMAQSQAGMMDENEKQFLKPRLVKKQETNEYLPNSYQQTLIHWYYEICRNLLR